MIPASVTLALLSSFRTTYALGHSSSRLANRLEMLLSGGAEHVQSDTDHASVQHVFVFQQFGL